MDKYLWESVEDGGVTRKRWRYDAIEDTPHPYFTRRFRLFTIWGPGVELTIPRGARFTCGKRYLPEDYIFWAGWQCPDDGGETWAFLSPDGEIEVAPSCDHVTRFERR